MRKRYSIEAKRKNEKYFTAWDDTDDISRVIELVDKVRELGYDVRVTDTGFKALEKKIENGYLVALPCRVGDTVYMPWEYKGVSGVAILTVTHVIIDDVHSYIRTNLALVSDSTNFLAAHNFGKFDFRQFGEKVFTSRKEAEKELEKLIAERSADESITVT